MITVTEAMALPTAQFEPDEEKMLATVLKKAKETVQNEFDGLGVYVNVPPDQATARVMAKACEMIRASSPWCIFLDFNFHTTPPLVAGGSPRHTLLSYVLIIAVDAVAERILRVRKETAS